MMTGFGWEIGAFESWDLLGVEKTVADMKKAGHKVATWVDEMLATGYKTFFTIKDGKRLVYSPITKSLVSVYAPGQENAFIVMKHFEGQTLWKNSACRTYHLGDDVLGLEWYTKMGSIGGEVLEGIQKSISLAEDKYKGLVIANEGNNFSAGANIGMIFMAAIEQEWDEINMAIRAFQNTSMRLRYSSIPVVVAPHNLTLGGSCEFSLHADHVQINAETYMGLVEFGVGLIPGGGGTKEFALRVSDELKDGQIDQNVLKDRFLTIAMAKVSTSGAEAADLGYLKAGKYSITMNRSRLIADAKTKALELADAGYTQPVRRTDIKVLGKSGLGIVYAGANSMFAGNYISEHDKKISEKLGYVMCGGDLSAPSIVSEQYLLDLEREAFLSLCGEKKTLERIQSIITKGKPLRN